MRRGNKQNVFCYDPSIYNNVGYTVYTITHISSGMVYYGCTSLSDRDAEKRRVLHLSALNRTVHENYKLQEAWIKEKDKKNFVFDVIGNFGTQREAKELEALYIHSLPSSKLFNIRGSKYYKPFTHNIRVNVI